LRQDPSWPTCGGIGRTPQETRRDSDPHRWQVRAARLRRQTGGLARSARFAFGGAGPSRRPTPHRPQAGRWLAARNQIPPWRLATVPRNTLRRTAGPSTRQSGGRDAAHNCEARAKPCIDGCPLSDPHGARLPAGRVARFASVSDRKASARVRRALELVQKGNRKVGKAN